MQKLFRISSEFRTEQLPSLPSSSENEHLHKLIENNLDLLPGDQINPDDPVRWLLIKSEMPVDDPESGASRWSLDLLLADHLAKPALVECKLSMNAEIRKEMIGQAIEYAANAQHYWDAEVLQRHAIATHGSREALEGKLKALSWTSIEDYFEALIKNLKQGSFRLVFAVDSAPYRLRSTVEFLNQELQDIEALVIEIQRYQMGAESLVASRVFGYTDRIRAAKREAEARKPGGGDANAFSAGLTQLADPVIRDAILAFRDLAKTQGWDDRYGTSGNLLLYKPGFDRRAVLTVSKKGDLTWYVAAFDQDRPDVAQGLRALSSEVGSTGAAQYPTSAAQAWAPKREEIMARLKVMTDTAKNVT